jgi:hypothetical protein
MKMMYRCILLALALCLAASIARAADQLEPPADPMGAPSSTIPGCLNDWSALPMGDTCEAKAERAKWEERQSAVTMAVNVVVFASRAPDRAAEGDVINALQALAAAADAARSAYHAPPKGMDELERFLNAARVDSEHWKLPIPVLYGDVFRNISVALQKPGTLRSEQAGLYDRAAPLALLLNETIGETVNDAVQQVNTATLQAHLAAWQAENAVQAGGTRGNSNAAITSAAAGHPEIAQAQITQLNQSLAAHPDQGSYSNRVARNLSQIFSTAGLLNFLLAIVLFTVITFVMYGAAALLLLARGIRSVLPTLVIMKRRQFIVLPVITVVGEVIQVLSGGAAGGWPLFAFWIVLFGVLMAACRG